MNWLIAVVVVLVTFPVLAVGAAVFWWDVRPALCECCGRKIPLGLGLGTGEGGFRYCSYQCMRTDPHECLGPQPTFTFLKGQAQGTDYQMQFKNKGGFAQHLTIRTEERCPVSIAPADLIDEGQKGVITVQRLSRLPAVLLVQYTDTNGRKRTLTLKCAEPGTFRQVELSGGDVRPQRLSQTAWYIGRALAARLLEPAWAFIIVLLCALLAIAIAYFLVGAA